MLVKRGLGAAFVEGVGLQRKGTETSEVKEGLEAEGSTAFLGWLCVYETKIHLRERGGAIEK